MIDYTATQYEALAADKTKTTYVVMYRDISDNDLMAHDTCVYITDSKYKAEWQHAGLEADESENCYYYIVSYEGDE